MIVDKILLIIKHEEPHFYPIINASTPDFYSHWLENRSFNIFDDLDETQQIHWVESISKTLDFCNQIYYITNGKNFTSEIRIERMINMILSFNFPMIDEEF